MSRFWSVHTHSRRSARDAMPGIKDLVAGAVELGYPALALTDHGDMGGVVELYLEGKKAGLPVAPGTELYVTTDAATGDRKSMHLTVIALTGRGYLNLVGLNNLAHRSFHHRPRVDFPQLAALAEQGLLEGLAVGTGCRSGPVVRALTERGPAAAEQVVVALAGWFPRLYVELMDHGFAADGMWDWQITEQLVGIAERTGLPTIITSDSHYVKREDQALHDAFKTLVTWSEDPEDGQFNGEGYWLVDEAHLEQVYAPKVLEQSLDVLSSLAADVKVTIPELDTFSLKLPDVTLKGTQQQTLEQLAWDRFEVWRKGDLLIQRVQRQKKPSKAVVARAEERLAAELGTVKLSGFAGYLLFVIAITDLCWEREIWFYTRGSATGSFLLWLSGVTQECPLDSEWDIRFDRFLSPDRASPPDVDIDIEHFRRNEVVEHFGQRYPYLQVGTTTTYGITAEVEDDEDSDQKGSLAQNYYSVQRRLGTGINDWASIPPSDKATLKELADMNLVQGRGAHPGGYVFADSPDLLAFMPLSFITSSKTLVTAVDKGEVEKMGLPKIDLLGSRVLTALRICCNLIMNGAQPEVPNGDVWADPREYYLSIPLDEKETMRRAAEGRTTGTFQLGGYTNRKVGIEMRPKRVKDLIAIQALARPAPMKAGFTRSFMRRRDKVETVPVHHEDIAAETADTYGLAIYQEQLVGVLRRLGIDPLRLTKLLKAVKASGKAHALEAAAIMDAEINPLLAIAEERGWAEHDKRWLTDCLRDYGAGYSFGKAHAVQYGVTGYRTLYLAQHESLAYWTGMLIAYTGVKDQKTKEPLELRYKAAARKDGVRVLPPHVLRSELEYSPDPEHYVIREGLLSVPGVGHVPAAELVAQRPYVSVIDLCKKVSNKVTGSRDVLFMDRAAFEAWCNEKNPATDDWKVRAHIAALYRAGALSDMPHGEPMRRAKGRIRRCKECKHTFSTPLEYEDHVDAGHPAIEDTTEGAA